MKPHLFIHRNLYARGLGFSVVREGRLIFNFWLWHLSGCFYLGERVFVEESFQNRKLAEADARAKNAHQAATAAMAEVNRLGMQNSALLAEMAYETREDS